MKIIYLLLFCLMSAHVYSQGHGLKDREVRRLERLGIAVQNFDLANDEIMADFKTILKLERKRKTAKALAIASISVSGVILVSGIVLLAVAPSTPEPGHLGVPFFRELKYGTLTRDNATMYGAVFTALGGLGLVPSWAHFKKARHLKNERDKLISKYLDPSL